MRRLPVSTHTLHLAYDQPSRVPQAIDCWRGRLHDSLLWLLEWGVPPSRLSIENLDYLLDWLAPVLLDLELAVCLDIGHLVVHAQDLPAALRQWAQITTIVHLHGVAGGRDHLALDCLPQEHLRSLMPFLRSFAGVLSLQVFNVENLQRSMAYPRRCWGGMGSCISTF